MFSLLAKNYNMKNSKMRNFIYSIVYFCLGAFLFVSCSQESADPFESDENIELRKSDNSFAAEASLKEIPKEFYDAADEYVETQSSIKLGRIDDASSIGLGCVWIDEEGYAHIKDGCSVNNDIPDFGCKVKARGIGDCFQLANDPNCVVCIIWVVLECDDKLFWYNKWFLIC